MACRQSNNGLRMALARREGLDVWEWALCARVFRRSRSVSFCSGEGLSGSWCRLERGKKENRQRVAFWAGRKQVPTGRNEGLLGIIEMVVSTGLVEWDRQAKWYRFSLWCAGRREGKGGHPCLTRSRLAPRRGGHPGGPHQRG